MSSHFISQNVVKRHKKSYYDTSEVANILAVGDDSKKSKKVFLKNLNIDEGQIKYHKFCIGG